MIVTMLTSMIKSMAFFLLITVVFIIVCYQPKKRFKNLQF